MKIIDHIGNNWQILADGLDEAVDSLAFAAQAMQDESPTQERLGVPMVVRERGTVPIDVGTGFVILTQLVVETKQQEAFSIAITKPAR